MHHRLAFGSLVTLALGAGLVVACGDDDEGGLGARPDGGAIDSSYQPRADGGDHGQDGGSDAATLAPIKPRTTTRIANAINPYGLRYASDGYLYASGATIQDATQKLAVWRFKDDKLDTTFGTGGVVTIDIAGEEGSFDIVEVSAGNFVVHAVSGGKVFLVKLTKDVGGTFSFGTPKFVKFGWNENEAWPDGTPSPPSTPPSYTSWGIALDKSNAASPKIVVFAHGAPAKAALATNQRVDNDRWITRVSADTLEFDTTFNGGAPFATDVDGQRRADNARRGFVLADGTIVSSGYTDFGTGQGAHIVLIRLKPDGTADSSFGFGSSVPGQTKFNPFLTGGGGAESYSVVRQSTGRYVTTGYGPSNFDLPSTNVDLVSCRVKDDGLDTTYGRLGAFAWQSEGDKSAGLGARPYTERGRGLVALPDDRTVQAGAYDDYAAIYVVDKDGKPDPSSGNNGLIEYAFPASFFSVTLSPDGKQIAATAQSLNQSVDAGAPLGSVLAILQVGP
jgi:uncharacterized delta-60 repeat protein